MLSFLPVTQKQTVENQLLIFKNCFLKIKIFSFAIHFKLVRSAMKTLNMNFCTFLFNFVLTSTICIISYFFVILSICSQIDSNALPGPFLFTLRHDTLIITFTQNWPQNCFFDNFKTLLPYVKPRNHFGCKTYDFSR